MAVIATVATRPRARSRATRPPAMSICDRTQPPKMSPLGLASAGMASVRMASAPRGWASGSAPGWAMVAFPSVNSPLTKSSLDEVGMV